MLNLWRSHFVLEEQMLEIKSTQLTPHVVLKYVVFHNFPQCSVLGKPTSAHQDPRVTDNFKCSDWCDRVLSARYQYRIKV